MRKLAATIILLAIFPAAYAQQKAADSLKKLINTAKEDTARIMLMNKLSHIYLYSMPDSALLIAQQALQLSKTIQFTKGEAYSLTSKGNVFTITGDYPKGLSTFLESLKIGEKSNDLNGVENTLHGISMIYSNESDYRRSIHYSLMAKAVAEANHDQRSLGITLLNLGDTYEKLNILDSALIYTQMSYKPFLQIKDLDLIGCALNNLGNIYTKMHKSDLALNNYRRSIPYSLQANDDETVCETTLGMAKIFRQLGQQDSSMYYARQSIAAGWHGGFTPRVLAASLFLMEYFEKQGRLDSAFHYQKVYIAAKDSLFSQEKTREVQKLDFAERQRQQDIQERDAVYKANMRFYIMLVVIVSLFVLAIVFWRNNRKSQKARRLLQEQKDQIQTTLGELKTTQNQLVQSAKMASLGELTAGIAHEIQNPLNFVNNFSEVNSEMFDELEEELKQGNIDEAIQLAADMKQNEEKIRHHGKRADFIVKGMLEHSRTGTGERQATNINVLADEFLKLSYHGLRAKDKDFEVELITNFDNNLPRINIVQQDIGRVLVNLYNNAFYTVKQKAKTSGEAYKPTIEVSTTQHNGSIMISVKDNGNGIPEDIREKIMQPFFTTKPTGEGTGLGLSLSYDIVVKGHEGSIVVYTKEGEFTEFTIRLPAK